MKAKINAICGILWEINAIFGILWEIMFSATRSKRKNGNF